MLGLSRDKGQVLVGFRFRDEKSSKHFKFEHHNPAALILYKPIVRAFSRIGDKFNLTRLSMQEHTITDSDFLTR
jgi:hypothetical protein